MNGFLGQITFETPPGFLSLIFVESILAESLLGQGKEGYDGAVQDVLTARSNSLAVTWMQRTLGERGTLTPMQGYTPRGWCQSMRALPDLPSVSFGFCNF